MFGTMHKVKLEINICFPNVWGASLSKIFARDLRQRSAIEICDKNIERRIDEPVKIVGGHSALHADR